RARPGRRRARRVRRRRPARGARARCARRDPRELGHRSGGTAAERRRRPRRGRRGATARRARRPARGTAAGSAQSRAGPTRSSSATSYDRAVRTDLGVTHVALPVTNLDASLAFYERFASMRVVHKRTDVSTGTSVAWISDLSRPFVLVLIETATVDTCLGGVF